MVNALESPSAQVRAKLSHPVIDTDGHLLEMTPILLDFIKEVGGADMLSRYLNGRMPYDGLGMSIEERRDSWTMCPPWWATPARNTLDRATATLPRLLHQRMDDIGLDFAVLYPAKASTSSACRDRGTTSCAGSFAGP